MHEASLFHELPHPVEALSIEISSDAALVTLTELTARHAARLTGCSATAVHIESAEPDLSLVSLGHPACEPHTGSAVCREFADAHLSALRERGVGHWHRCPFQLWCAFLPVLCDGRCVLACKMVGAAPTLKPDFERNLALTRRLLDELVIKECQFLCARRGSNGRGSIAPPSHAQTTPIATHPQVWEAVKHTHRNLADSKLSVNDIAAALGINATYLAHMFSQQLGMRMRHYIATRRIAMAAALLAATDWQIKQIAYETGHSNADWFSHIFHAWLGITPTEYRNGLCSPAPTSSFAEPAHAGALPNLPTVPAT